MSDENASKDTPETARREHAIRVAAAFDDLKAALGERATPEARAALETLREAVLGGNPAELRLRLEDVKARHGWLYAELARHPRFAELVNELALFGL